MVFFRKKFSLTKEFIPETAAGIKSFRSSFWFFQGLLDRYGKIISLSFIIAICLFILSIKVLPKFWPTEIKSTKIGMVGAFTPSQLPLKIQNLLSIGLTQVKITGEIEPGLAINWQTNDQGKEYVFNLKEDIYWHDGKKFTAFDVNYNLKDVEFIPLDNQTLKIKLKESFSPLPTFLSKPLFKKGLIGLGSYKIKTIKLKGDQVIFMHLEPIDLNLPVFEIKFFFSETVAKTAFKLGEIDVLDEINDPSSFINWVNLDIKDNVKYDQYLALFFNLKSAVFKQKEFRQALAYAIDKSDKNRVASPISRKSWVYTDQVKQYEKDLEKVNELMKGNKFTETITLSVYPQYLKIGENIVSQWQKSGINVKIKVVDQVNPNYQILLASQEILPDPDQYPLWHSTQKDTNITGYANPKIDKLLEDGRKEQDVQKRKDIYFNFQKYLVEDIPAIFLIHPTTYSISRH